MLAIGWSMWKRKASNITHERNDVPGIGDIPVVLWDTLRSYCNNATTIGNLAQFFTPNENILNYKWVCLLLCFVIMILLQRDHLKNYVLIGCFIIDRPRRNCDGNSQNNMQLHRNSGLGSKNSGGSRAGLYCGRCCPICL